MSHELQTVAIKYGWAEGPLLAARLAAEMKARGFILTKDDVAADIIFAHSSGCYQVPKEARAGLVLLVGLPIGPAYALLPRLGKKLLAEFHYHHGKNELGWWLRKLTYNAWYMMTKPVANYYVLTRHKMGNLPDRAGGGRRVVLVRPRDDAFMPPDTNELLAGRWYEFVEIAGEHDHCWVEPQPYVDLIVSMSETA